ncbi:SDR family oxidoreductase [Bordetella muralis]|jgi:NAD(P)-dependent dehydrogenase (short-subunit alcohol dehydrogenase family)|uniref:SDR family oxidoreductase n=1 Tax=Bordetella muralis TaxID=1649130 RepID=UPI0039F12B84
MKLKGSVALVTGANRGLGLEFSKQLLERGAAKIYAAARNPASVTLPGVVPIQLDVTKPEEVAQAARACGDVTVLINNAGIARLGGLLTDNSDALLREQLETNLFGALDTSRAFAGILGRNGGGALVNILSIASWINSPAIAAYSVSKAAAWSLTNGLRHELRAQGTQVLGFHGGFIDTDLVRDFDVPKAKPADVVCRTLDALEAGEEEVTVDEPSLQVKHGLSHGVYLNDMAAG